MYSNNAYLNHSLDAFEDKSKPLIVSSAGTYRLHTVPDFETNRPLGRADYQLLYIASGETHFYFEDGKDEKISAGHMVLYRPHEMQKYIYYSEEHPEVYWVHFTGSDVEEILKRYSFPADNHIILSGTAPDYQRLFLRMIQELQLCKPHYEDALSLLLQELFIAVSRHLKEEREGNNFAQKEMEYAIHYFNENYNKDINIEEYAASRHMSVSWFIRNFKRYNNLTPLNYILSIRIANAKSLLENTCYNISEIAAIVGYDNALYFSRLFHKQVGMSPSEYARKARK